MKIFGTLAPLHRRNLLLLFATGLLFWASIASLLPTLPSYIQHIGGTTQQVGFVMGAIAIGLLLFRPWLGQMADRQSRKGVLLLGTTVAAIAPLGYLLVTSIPFLIAIRAFHGISIAAFTTAYSTLVVDLSPLAQRGELIGYMSLVNPIGMALGPAIGGLLEAQVGYSPLFCFASALAIISLLAAIRIREVRQQENQTLEKQDTKVSSIPYPPSPIPNTSIWEILSRRSLLFPALVLLLVGFAFGAITTFVPLYITEAKVNLNAGWFYTVAAIASFSLRLFTGRASDRYGRGLFITASLCCYCLAALMLSQARSAIAFLLAGMLEGAGSGILIPMMIALISDRSASYERGQVFAICMSGFDLGLAIAGPVLGSLVEQIGYRGIFALCTALSFLALIVFMTCSSNNFSHSLKFSLGRERDIYAVNEL